MTNNEIQFILYNMPDDEGKEFGLIVDYIGIRNNMLAAVLVENYEASNQNNTNNSMKLSSFTPDIHKNKKYELPEEDGFAMVAEDAPEYGKS